MAKKTISPKIIAHRYATALYDLAKENKAITPVLSDLTQFRASLAQAPVALVVLGNPKIDLQEKQAAMEALIKKGKAHQLSALFFKVLIVQNRFGIFNEIVDQFQNIYDKDQGIHIVEAVTATKLNKAQQDILEENLKKALGASAIDLKTSIDPSILGGILIRFGSTLVDDTIKNKLNRIAKKMKGIA